MPTIHHHNDHHDYRRLRRLLVALAVVLALGAAACGGGDDEADRAEAEGVGLDDAATTTTAAPEGDSTSDDPTGAGEVPQDRDLDVQMRNPDGTTLTVSHVAFDGDNIALDLEFFNGSPRDIFVHSTAGGEGALRLVDDAGNVYNFLVPAEEAASVYTTVAQGETLSGTFVFLGPLIGHPQQLRLVTNVAQDQIDSWTLDDEVNRGACCLEPGFVVPIDLDWG